MVNNNTEIYHHGIKGQRWGIRRFQNKDGSLTPAGRKRAEQEDPNYRSRFSRKRAIKKGSSGDSDSDAPKKKSLRDLSDEELTALNTRRQKELDNLRIEKQYRELYRELNPKHVSAGEKFVKSVAKDVIAPAAKQAGRQYAEKLLKEKLGLNDKNTLDGLRKEVEGLRLKKELADLKNPKKDPYKEMQEALKKHATKTAYDKMMEEEKKKKS